MRGVLRLPFWRAYPAIAIGHAAILDVEGVDHAVADKPVMIGIARCELRVGAVAVERAGKLLRQRTADRQIGGVGFERHRREISGEERPVGKYFTHDALRLAVGCSALAPRVRSRMAF